MVTILLTHGFRFVIFANDHEPAHVHVFGDGHLKIDLTGQDGPTLVWADGMKRGDIRKAMSIATERCAEFLDRWRSIHG